jgi:hypothetical protein
MSAVAGTGLPGCCLARLAWRGYLVQVRLAEAWLARLGRPRLGLLRLDYGVAWLAWRWKACGCG